MAEELQAAKNAHLLGKPDNSEQGRKEPAEITGRERARGPILKNLFHPVDSLRDAESNILPYILSQEDHLDKQNVQHKQVPEMDYITCVLVFIVCQLLSGSAFPSWGSGYLGPEEDITFPTRYTFVKGRLQLALLQTARLHAELQEAEKVCWVGFPRIKYQDQSCAVLPACFSPVQIYF